MKLPELNNISKSADYRIEFKGYNHNMYVGEDQFYDMQNLCATNYPVMTPRAARATVRTISGAQGLFARGKLMWAAGGRLYWDGEDVGAVSDGVKQFVGMGVYVVIFPDALRFDTSKKTLEPLGAEWAQSEAASITLSRLDGSDYEDVTAGDSAPENPVSGDYWLDTSGDTHYLKVYSSGAWTTIPTTYARIESAGIGASFARGDAVTISGGPDIINGVREIAGRTNDSITIPCVLDKAVTVESGMTVTRDIPQMDYVCELNNRLWGCSSAKHEVYCCKLGDPKNWNTLGTGAADAWAATIGSDGDFTGCCAFGGSVLFWKEDMLHKVFGSKSSNFQISDSPIRGVQSGCAGSLCVVNESLLYKSREGVCIYDSGNPMGVSQQLGTGSFYEASAGALGDRYYISMRDQDDAWHLFVFNEAKGMWHREDATHALAFAELNGQLYYIDAADGRLMAVRGREEAGAEREEPFDWYAETGDMLVDMPDNKYLRRIQVRASVDQGATLKIEAQYDSSGEWMTIYKRGQSRKASFTIPIVPMRCDHVRLRISGHGRSAVYAIGKEIERGSEL